MYSPHAVLQNLALLHSRSKIHHLASTPNYAFLTLLSRKPRRDQLVQPFLHLKHAMSALSASEGIVSRISQAAEYVYGRRLGPEELRWLEERASIDGIWSYISCLASVRSVNEMANSIREKEGLSPTPKSEEAENCEKGRDGREQKKKRRRKRRR